DYRLTMMHLTRCALWIGAVAALIVARPEAQSSGTLTGRVTETAGIPRTNYPARTRVRLPRAALADAAHARLLSGGKEVPAQFGVESSYPDGSVEWLTLDFNVALAPRESAAYVLEYGAEVRRALDPRGLTLMQDAD